MRLFQREERNAQGAPKTMNDIPVFNLTMSPAGTNHSYHTSGGRWYKDGRVVAWEAENLLNLKKVKYRPAKTEDYCVNIGFYFDNKRKNDIDGRIKAVLDILGKAGFYADDSLIIDLIVSKRYDKEKPRIEVSVY